MTIKKEISLTDFEFWAGARANAAALTIEQLEQLEQLLEDSLSDGSGAIDETAINDIFWFETDWIAELLGFETWDALEKENAYKGYIAG